MNRQTELLKRAVSEAFQIPWEALLTRRKIYKHVLPKKIFIYLNQEMLGVGCKETANEFSFDHSTAIVHKHSVKDLLSIQDEDMTNGVTRVKEIYNTLKAAV